MALPVLHYPPVGIDADGSLFMDGYNQLARLDPQGQTVTLAGNLLEGSKDGPATGTAEVIDVGPVQPMADGTLLMLDEAPGATDTLVRLLGPDRAGPRLSGKPDRVFTF